MYQINERDCTEILPPAISSRKMYRTTKPALFCLVRFKPFHLTNGFTDLNPSESGEIFFLVNCVVLNAKKKQLSYFCKRSHSVQSIPTSATSRDRSLLKPCFFSRFGRRCPDLTRFLSNSSWLLKVPIV